MSGIILSFVGGSGGALVVVVSANPFSGAPISDLGFAG